MDLFAGEPAGGAVVLEGVDQAVAIAEVLVLAARVVEQVAVLLVVAGDGRRACTEDGLGKVVVLGKLAPLVALGLVDAEHGLVGEVQVDGVPPHAAGLGFDGLVFPAVVVGRLRLAGARRGAGGLVALVLGVGERVGVLAPLDGLLGDAALVVVLEVVVGVLGDLEVAGGERIVDLGVVGQPGVRGGIDDVLEEVGRDRSGIA